MCKACLKKYYSEPARKEARKEARKKYYQEHKEEKAAYYQANRDRVLKQQKTPAAKMAHKYAKMKYKYDVTKKEYHDLYNSQNGKCLICGIDLKILDENTHVDHDHKSGKVRGLLCRDCNHGIGLLDTLAKLHKAIDYLENS